MSLIIHNVTSAATQINYKYLDSIHLFGLDVQGTYTFSIDDLDFEEGEGILNGTEGFNALRNVYTNKSLLAKIGTDIFRNGIITSLSRGEQNSVNSNEVTITIKETQRVDDDGELSDISITLPSPHKIESFSETFSFSRNDGEISYVRDVSLKYADDISDQFLNNAYIFLKSVYFESRPAYGFQVDGLTEKATFDKEFLPRISENYDLVNKSVSLTENFTASDVQEESKYSKKVTYSIRSTEDGFQEKEYNIEIVGLKHPVSQHVMNGAITVIDDIVSTENSVYEDPISITKGVIKDSNKMSIQMLFSTDRSKNQTTSLTYSVTRTLNGSFFDYSITMERKRKGRSPDAAFKTLVVDWGTDLATPKNKIDILFAEASTLTLYEKSRSTSFAPNDASISETIVFTTDPAYNTSGDILKQNVTVNVNNPVERIFVFATPKDKERVQRLFTDQQGTLGNKSITVELIKRKGDEDLLAESEAFTIAEQFAPTETNWLVNKTSSINPTEGTTTVNLAYDFFWQVNEID